MRDQNEADRLNIVNYMISKYVLVLVSTLFIWLTVIAVAAISTNHTYTNGAVALAFLSTISLWLVAGLKLIDEKLPSAREKAKRDSGQDARLALLLELLDEDERQALKRRLVDDLSGDGETISLAQLLDAEQEAARQHRS
ncbi:MAG TPA: hypothetical protein VMT24_14335 [Aggregatilineaceae bacterium]|nr:hypothetical protein [Aggregatilineaceae bacterium]